MEACMKDAKSIDVPKYSSKFIVLCHPEVERLVVEGEAWLRARAKESGFADRDSEVEKLIASNFPRLACQFWPHSSNLKLTLTLVKIMYWFFIFDNVMDEPSVLGYDAVACQEICGLVLKAFFSLDASVALAGLVHLLPARASHALSMPTLAIKVLVEWWSELHDGMSARQQARFCSHFADYVLVHPKQARFKGEKEVPGVEEYMRMRLLSGAMYMVEVLAELDCEIELDEEELRNPSMRRLNDTIGLHAGLINDYVGFATEHVRGENFNLLTVLHYRNNVPRKGAPVPFERACAEAWAIIRGIEEEGAGCAKAVDKWAHMHSKLGYLKYVASLCSMSAATWLFAVESPRYTDFNKHCVQLPAVEKDQENSITRIFLTDRIASRVESSVEA